MSVPAALSLCHPPLKPAGCSGGCRASPHPGCVLSPRRLPRAVLGPRLQAELPVPPQWALPPRERPLHLRPRPLGRALPVLLPVRPPRPLRPPERRLPLRAGLVGTQLQEAMPVQPLHVPLRPPERAVPLPAGLVGQEVQLQVLLQRLALRAGDGQVRVPGWLLGAGVPAALRLRARLLQSPHRPLHLRARLPGQELPGPLSGREIRISVRAQVRLGSRGGSSGAAVRSWGKSLRLCPSLWLGRGTCSGGLSISGWMQHQRCPKRNTSLLPAESVTLKSGHPYLRSPW